jgi:hypothetical protein
MGPIGSPETSVSSQLTLRKGKNTHTAGRPAACDLIRGNKAVDLFPRIESQADGRSAPPRCMCVFTLMTQNTEELSESVSDIER